MAFVRVSGWLGHLGGMEPITTTDNAELDPTVPGGAFEQAPTVNELAAELQGSCQTLYDLPSQGRGPAKFRIGRHLRIRRSAVQAWLERLEHPDAERHHGSAS